MATFWAIILFSFSLYYYNTETISLEMLLLICALCLIVCAIDSRPTASEIREALLEVFSKKMPSKPDETEPVGYKSEDDYDIDEYPHLKM